MRLNGWRIDYKKLLTVLKIILVLDVVAIMLIIGAAIPTRADVAVAQDSSPQNQANPQPSIRSVEKQPVTLGVDGVITSHSQGNEQAVKADFLLVPQLNNQSASLSFSNAAKQPPVPNQGGTCISGYVINSYHETVGADWVVKITNSAGETKSTKTDSKGYFGFAELTGGTWEVEVEVPEGWRPYTPEKFTVTLSGEGSSCAQVRFKLEALSCIKVIKLDEGGMVGFDDMVGIPGWTMTATQGETILKSVTNGQGYAFFDNLLPGQWIITEEDKSGWVPADGYSNEQLIFLTPPHWPGSCEELVFVNKQINEACINVIKRDTAGNPVVDWVMNLTRDDGTREPQVEVTDGEGEAEFTGLALGDWTVTEEVKEWWRVAGSDSKSVTLEEPGVCVNVEFANEPLGCVDGYKINDLEEGLPGWKITATNSDTGDKVVTTTDENGYFAFKYISLGNWVITEELQEGWEAVTPSEFTVDVRTPFVCEHVRFKNRTPFACVDVFKKDSTDGVGLPGWTIDLTPAFGGIVQSKVTDGTGWVRFIDLHPGMYTISEELLPGWDNVTPTEVTVELFASGKCTVINFENIQENMQEPEEPEKPPEPKPAKDHHDPCHHCTAWYTVKPGDTLWSIANRFNTTISALLRANHLGNPNLIYAGTRLCIP